MGRRYDIDWEAIERDFRIGQLSIRELAKRHGVSAAQISRKAEKEKWVQDLSREVREKTRAALLTGDQNSPESIQSAAEGVQVAVETNVSLVVGHRQDIREGRDLTRLLLSELRESTLNREEIEAAIEAETAGDRDPKRRNAMLRAVALPSRSTVIGNLAGALKTLIGLERQAFNLDAATAEEGEAGDLSRMSEVQLECLIRRLAGDSPGEGES